MRILKGGTYPEAGAEAVIIFSRVGSVVPPSISFGKRSPKCREQSFDKAVYEFLRHAAYIQNFSLLRFGKD